MAVMAHVRLMVSLLAALLLGALQCEGSLEQHPHEGSGRTAKMNPRQAHAQAERKGRMLIHDDWPESSSDTDASPVFYRSFRCNSAKTTIEVVEWHGDEVFNNGRSDFCLTNAPTMRYPDPNPVNEIGTCYTCGDGPGQADWCDEWEGSMRMSCASDSDYLVEAFYNTTDCSSDEASHYVYDSCSGGAVYPGALQWGYACSADGTKVERIEVWDAQHDAGNENFCVLPSFQSSSYTRYTSPDWDNVVGTCYDECDDRAFWASCGPTPDNAYDYELGEGAQSSFKWECMPDGSARYLKYPTAGCSGEASPELSLYGGDYEAAPEGTFRCGNVWSSAPPTGTPAAAYLGVWPRPATLLPSDSTPTSPTAAPTHSPTTSPPTAPGETRAPPSLTPPLLSPPPPSPSPPPPSPSPPPPSPSPPSPYVVPVVESTISFALVDITTVLSDNTFNTTFKAQMASSAGVSPSDVEITRIISGSVTVTSKVYFPASTAAVADAAGSAKAEQFAKVLQQESTTVFSESFRTTNGDVTVLEAGYTLPPPSLSPPPVAEPQSETLNETTVNGARGCAGTGTALALLAALAAGVFFV